MDWIGLGGFLGGMGGRGKGDGGGGGVRHVDEKGRFIKRSMARVTRVMVEAGLRVGVMVRVRVGLPG